MSSSDAAVSSLNRSRNMSGLPEAVSSLNRSRLLCRPDLLAMSALHIDGPRVCLAFHHNTIPFTLSFRMDGNVDGGRTRALLEPEDTDLLRSITSRYDAAAPLASATPHDTLTRWVNSLEIVAPPESAEVAARIHVDWLQEKLRSTSAGVDLVLSILSAALRSSRARSVGLLWPMPQTLWVGGSQVSLLNFYSVMGASASVDHDKCAAALRDMPSLPSLIHANDYWRSLSPASYALLQFLLLEPCQVQKSEVPQDIAQAVALVRPSPWTRRFLSLP
jgi:hypothetical protein